MVTQSSPNMNNYEFINSHQNQRSALLSRTLSIRRWLLTCNPYIFLLLLLFLSCCWTRGELTLHEQCQLSTFSRCLGHPWNNLWAMESGPWTLNPGCVHRRGTLTWFVFLTGCPGLKSRTVTPLTRAWKFWTDRTSMVRTLGRNFSQVCSLF